ncbi:MAG TPA: hypothetical protein VGE74_10980 [Gemmata sp.]
MRHARLLLLFAGEVHTGVRAWGDPLNARDPRQGANGCGASNRPPLFVLLDGPVRSFDARELAELVGKVPE